MFSLVHWTSLAGVLKNPRVKRLNKKNKLNKFLIMLERNSINVRSNTRPTARTAKVRTGWPYRWFGHFFNGLAKSPRVLRSSWILNEYTLYCKIVKYMYCILSEVCIIKTVPHSTVSPQMSWINGIKRLQKSYAWGSKRQDTPNTWW